MTVVRGVGDVCSGSDGRLGERTNTLWSPSPTPANPRRFRPRVSIFRKEKNRGRPVKFDFDINNEYHFK